MMGRRLKPLAGFLFCFAALLLVTVGGLIRLPQPSWDSAAAATGRLDLGGSPVAQSFAAPWPGLSGVRLTLERSGLEQPCRVTARLGPQPPGSDLWSQSFVLRDVAGPVQYRFDFRPLRAAQGQAYVLTLEAPSCAAGSVTVPWDSLASLAGGTAHKDGSPQPGAMQFQTYHTLTWWQKAGLLLTRLAQGRPLILGSTSFYAVLAGAYWVVLAVFLVYVAHGLAGERGRS